MEVPVQEFRRAVVDRVAAVKGGDLCHVLVCQCEVEELDVLGDVRGRLRTRDDDVPLLHVPAEDDLRGGLPVGLGDLVDQGARS